MRFIFLFLGTFVYFGANAQAPVPPVVIESAEEATPAALDTEGFGRRRLVFRFGEYERNYRAELTHPLPSCEGLESKELIVCRRIRKAQAIADTVHPRIFEDRADGKKVVWREFALIAYSEAGKDYHTILFQMPIGKNGHERLQLMTPGYAFERVRGSSLNQMVFRVWREEEELLVYAGRFVVVPPNQFGAIFTIQEKLAERVTYLATHDHFNLPGFCQRGRAYLHAHLQDVNNLLRELRVPSLAYPGKLVADVVPPEIGVVIIGIEQSDMARLFGQNNEKFPRYEVNNEEFCRVYTRFMVNGLSAFRFICSNMHACGPFQLTNSRGDGTYALVRRKYPKAGLDSDFMRGASSFFNSAKASMLLVDYELSNSNLPNWVRELYRTDIGTGALFPIAAYNGGPSEAMQMVRLFERYRNKGKELSRNNLPLDAKDFTVPISRKKGVRGEFKPETAGYVGKYYHLSRFLER
jgi:hypothetical protein